MTRFFPLVLLLLLAGCATHHPKRGPINSVPAARRFENQLLRPSARRNCAITLVREAGVKGYGLNVYLDGELAARIAAGELITLYVRPGKHQLSGSPGAQALMARACTPPLSSSARVSLTNR